VAGNRLTPSARQRRLLGCAQFRLRPA
jgi:hypothetical protein